MSELAITKVSKPGTLPDESQLGFGKHFTDHMFVMDYETGKGWHSPRIEPYGTFGLEPSAMVLHYGQAIFEGMKAFRQESQIVLFRTKDYLNRFNRSADILCIPRIDVDVVAKGLKTLLEIDQAWVPGKQGTSLYIRPFIVANDPYVGVKSSDHYKLFIILSPVGAYYAAGFNPVSIQEEAKKEGFAQVLWLDATERKYIEEVGTMNIFFKINGELITPALNGSILGGITRRTVIELAKEWGVPVSEREISIDEVFEANAKGQLEEAFGSGTAAVISPVGELSWKGEKIIINGNQTGPFAQRLFDQVTGIQYGVVPDKHNWIDPVAKI